MASQKASGSGTTQATVEQRLRDITLIPWWTFCKKKLLLIRPILPGDTYTTMGSNVWAGDVKTKAIAEGWDVRDLNGDDATRANIEDALNTYKPGLVMHYDHGSNFTMYGQNSGALEAGLDESNIALVSGRILSTVSCLSASGLGPDAITEGVTSYLGYTDLHTFWTDFPAEFGAAANAANFALLECKTLQEAFDRGWTAYDDLYADLHAGGFDMEAAAALHDRDCFALLGSTTNTACPSCTCHGGLPLHCVVGGPDSVCKFGGPACAGLPIHACTTGLPLHCVSGLPDSLCKYGNPYILCGHSLPDVSPCLGLPMLACSLGGPATSLCGKGPDGCSAGPPLILQDIYTDYPDDLVLVDRAKVPRSMRKAFDAMIKQMQRERR